MVRVAFAACLFAVFHAHAGSPLEQALLRAVREARFDRLIDFGPANEGRDIPPGSARTIAHIPNVDVAVVQFGASGQALACANVLLSRDYPDGLIVPLDPHRGASSVRFIRWDIDRWNGGQFLPGQPGPHTTKGWTNDPPLLSSDDMVPGRTDAPYRFMSPYPASLFKLLVAVQVMRMVDAGWLALDAPCVYAPLDAPQESRPLRQWLDAMITVSDNRATQALIQMLHLHRRIDAMNREFRDLGLDTLRIDATRASDGRGWQTDRIHMTAFDTARLLWLIEGPPGVLWTSPVAGAVTAGYLTPNSRAFLKKLLEEQALNEALSNSNLAGLPHVRPGIPSRISDRWINPVSGTVNAGGIDFGADVRFSNANAQVTFAHKTGLTYNYASDAGIVVSLPGKPYRRYIIAFLSNLGYRYTDEVFAGRTRGPYADARGPIAYTQRIPALARAIDEAMIELSSSRVQTVSEFHHHAAFPETCR